MKNKKVHFKQAIKKQIWTITFAIGGVIAYPMLLGGLKTDLELYLWILMVAMVSYVSFIVLKKQSKEALCPHCEADLFEVIEISKSVKLEFNFCPNCGKEIEI